MELPGENDEQKRAFYQRIFDELIRPQLQQLADQIEGIEVEDLENAQIDITQIGGELGDIDLSQASGEAVLLGSNNMKRVQEIMQGIQEHMQEGISLDYILQELTDAKVDTLNSSQLGNIRVNMVTIKPEDEERVDNLSPDELRNMFER